ncbi:MAG: hypothetical protein QRY72_04150 [Candidatus Rhabdochlamydia sp.]
MNMYPISSATIAQDTVRLKLFRCIPPPFLTIPQVSTFSCDARAKYLQFNHRLYPPMDENTSFLKDNSTDLYFKYSAELIRLSTVFRPVQGLQGYFDYLKSVTQSENFPNKAKCFFDHNCHLFLAGNRSLDDVKAMLQGILNQQDRLYILIQLAKNQLADLRKDPQDEKTYRLVKMYQQYMVWQLDQEINPSMLKIGSRIERKKQRFYKRYLETYIQEKIPRPSPPTLLRQKIKTLLSRKDDPKEQLFQDLGPLSTQQVSWIIQHIDQLDRSKISSSKVNRFIQVSCKQYHDLPLDERNVNLNQMSIIDYKLEQAIIKKFGDEFKVIKKIIKCYKTLGYGVKAVSFLNQLKIQKEDFKYVKDISSSLISYFSRIPESLARRGFPSFLNELTQFHGPWINDALLLPRRYQETSSDYSLRLDQLEKKLMRIPDQNFLIFTSQFILLLELGYCYFKLENYERVFVLTSRAHKITCLPSLHRFKLKLKLMRLMNAMAHHILQKK